MNRSHPLRATLSLIVASIIFFQVSSALGQVVGFDAFRYENRFGGNWGGTSVEHTSNDFFNFKSDGAAGGAFIAQGLGRTEGPEGPGVNINPADYQLQVTYRLGPTNDAFQFNIEARQDDGDDGSMLDDGVNPNNTGETVDSQVGTGIDFGENFQWAFNDMDLDYADAVDAGQADADGFVTLTRDIWDPATQAGIFDGTYIAWGYDQVGDGLMDWDAYEGCTVVDGSPCSPTAVASGRPNGLIEMQIQAVAGGTLDIDVKNVLFVPKDPLASLYVFDANHGVTGTFGTAQTLDGEAPRYSRGDGTDFTNVILDYRPIDGVDNGGAFIDVPPSAASLDGNEHVIEIKAKLLPDNTATELVVELFDEDGFAPDDDGNRDGFVDASVDQMGVVFDITQLNDSTFTTLTVPISDVLDPDSASWLNDDITAWGAEAVGDGSIDSLDIYRLSVNSVFQTTDRLNIEIESLRIVPDDGMGGGGMDIVCDFDGDGDCDLVDIDTLYDNFGAVGGAFDVDNSGTVDDGDIGAWLALASTEDGSRTFLIGDVNLDGSVNSTDLGLLLNNFNNEDGLAYSSGNLNDDPNVNSTDLGLLLNNFGTSSANAVPEPAGLSLMLFAVLGLFIRSRRRS